MSKSASVAHRRRFIRLAATGFAAVPLGNALFAAEAKAAEMVSESDAKAVALKYVTDAAKSTNRKDPAAVCDNCNLYTGKPGDATGACEIFDGKLVAAKGWCLSWDGY